MQLLLVLIFVLPNFQSGKLTKTKVTDNISMLMPEEFRPMTDDEIASKYFTTKRPMALFTNLNQTVDIGLNQAVTKWEPNDLEIMMSFQKSNIYALYDEINMISEGIKEVNKKRFGYFEFESVVKPEEGSFLQKGAISKYTYIQYVLVDGQSLVFNFTCPSQLRQQWSDIAVEIMNNITINGKIK